MAPLGMKYAAFLSRQMSRLLNHGAPKDKGCDVFKKIDIIHIMKYL